MIYKAPKSQKESGRLGPLFNGRNYYFGVAYILQKSTITNQTVLQTKHMPQR